MKTAFLGLALSVCVAGQAPPPPAATFEVASIKPSPPDNPGMFIRFLPGGGVRFSGISLKNLIVVAYGVREFQVLGGAEWVDSQPFDVEGKGEAADGETDQAQMREYQRRAIERLKSLLADRFQLALHHETREQPVYALVVAKGGPKLQETEGRTFIRGGRGTLKGESVGVSMLVLNLSNVLGRRVNDKTGLSGKYSFELKWAPEGAADATGPSIFSALTEQLGLRLEAEKGPVEMLVIDRAERPSKN